MAAAATGQHLSAMTRGCLAGTSVCFISNEGEVYPCGYLPVSAGNTRLEPFADIWRSSPVFEQLRNPGSLEGKCGDCRFEAICGGCRARAYAATGSFWPRSPSAPIDQIWMQPRRLEDAKKISTVIPSAHS